MKNKTLVKIFTLCLALLGIFFACSDPEPSGIGDDESKENDILTFSFPEQTGPADIDKVTEDIVVEVAYGTDLTTLTPEFTISPKAEAEPPSGIESDYSDTFTIVVTAENDNNAGWKIVVNVAAAPLTVANPIDDVRVLKNADNTEIDLTDVFTDANNDDTEITKAVQENTNTDLLTATITDNTLTLNYEEDQLGTATITIRATSGGNTVDDVFEVTVSEKGSGDAIVEFGDGGTKATAIKDLEVDGITYDVEFLIAKPSEIYGDWPGTYTFTTNDDAVAAVDAVNTALNDFSATRVGKEGEVADEGRYRIGYMDVVLLEINNTRFKLGIFEPASWREGLEETNPYNAEPVTWAVFTAKGSGGPGESSENDVLTFTIPEQTGDADIDATNHTVDVDLV